MNYKPNLVRRWLPVAAAVATLAAGAGEAAPSIAPSAAPEPVAAMAFLEGPAATESGDLYFTDLVGNRIWRMSPSGALMPFRTGSNYANGLAIDEKGRLLAAENGDAAAGTPARVTRTDLATGKVEVLASQFDGKALAGPNDVTVDGRGRIYFTDWVRPDVLPPGPPGALNPFGVYRIDLDGSVHRLLVQPQVQAPNGVMISPDDKTLYLVEANRAAGGARRIVAYELKADGSLGAGRLFHDFAPGRSGDGMAVDEAGRLWVAAGLNNPRPGGETMDTKAGVYVFTPSGELIAFHPVAEDLISNVAFGGPGRRTVYVTAGKTLFKLPALGPGTRR